eukprot:RCo035914
MTTFYQPADSLPFGRPSDEIASLVRPGLFLGDASDASNLPWLKHHGITHVLNVTDDVWEPADESIVRNGRFKRIAVQDREYERLLPHFEGASEFIQSALATNHQQENRVMLVHCREGVSRSATVVIAHLMQTEKLRLGEAFGAVKQARQIIEPNAGFLNQLRQLEKRLFGSVETTQKLTVLDEGGTGLSKEWLDTVKDALGDVAVSATLLDIHASSLRAILEEAPSDSRAEMLLEMMQDSLRRRSTLKEGDVLARQMLAQLLQAIVQADQASAGTALKPALHAAVEKFGSEEVLDDVVLDVPRARQYYAELKDKLSASL